MSDKDSLGVMSEINLETKENPTKITKTAVKYDNDICEYKEWNDNGMCLKFFRYKNEYLDGDQYLWRDDGSLISYFQTTNGILNGIYVRCNNKFTISEETFYNGNLHGYQHYYYEDGSRRGINYYNNGILDSYQTYFFLNSNIQYIEFISNGKMVVKYTIDGNNVCIC